MFIIVISRFLYIKKFIVLTSKLKFKVSKNLKKKKLKHGLTCIILQIIRPNIEIINLKKI